MAPPNGCASNSGSDMSDTPDLVGIETIVVHSGGMDSSLCLALAVRDFGREHVLSLGFDYGQRHDIELERAAQIAEWFGVQRYVVDLSFYSSLTKNALMDASIPIRHVEGDSPNTLVVGRNGLMVRLAAILAGQFGAGSVYAGVIGVDGANSGYRDCSREYMDLVQAALRLDLADDTFEVRTPLVEMTKKETMELGHELGCLEFLLETTVTCYRGVPLAGCGKCPACRLRNEGIRRFVQEHPEVKVPWQAGTKA